VFARGADRPEVVGTVWEHHQDLSAPMLPGLRMLAGLLF
jgi:hypothetical protein